MDTLIDFLPRRAAPIRRRLARELRGVRARRRTRHVPTDDLDASSGAAWRLGRGSEAVRLAERVFDSWCAPIRRRRR